MKTINTKQDLLNYLNGKIESYGNEVKCGKEENQRSALGELSFLIAIRTIINHPQGKEDSNEIEQDSSSLFQLGNIDAINDLLENMGIIKSGTNFYEL